MRGYSKHNQPNAGRHMLFILICDTIIETIDSERRQVVIRVGKSCKMTEGAKQKGFKFQFDRDSV